VQATTEHPEAAVVLAEASEAKKTQDRVGDWVCQRCSNHNFSFRHVCNKCQLTLQENDEILVFREQQATQQQQAGLLCAGPAPAQMQAPVGHLPTTQFIPQMQPCMGNTSMKPNGLVHVQQYTTNCSFNTYQVQPQQPCFNPAANQGNAMVMNQQAPQTQPFFPCFTAQQQLP